MAFINRDSSMRIIIAGGSGVIGRELANELTQAGYEVIILSRNPEHVLELPQGVKAVSWDGKTTKGWCDLVDGAKAVVNLAGENLAGEKFFPDRWTESRKHRILQSRLDAGSAIEAAIRAVQNKPGVLLQSSAIGYYGSLDDQDVDEKSPVGSGYLARICQEWEKSTETVESMGVRWVVLRTGVVLSMKGGAFTRLLMPFNFFAGGPMGNGRQYISWIHIADEVGAIQFLIENQEARGIINLTAPVPVTNAEFVRIIGHVMGRPSFLPLPAFVLRLMFGEVSTTVLDGQRVLPRRLEALGYQFIYPEAELAIRELLGK
jgi:uncharacterized protein (TIGR01777 family)